jgi:RND family efflux transporter MFP subunit
MLCTANKASLEQPEGNNNMRFISGLLLVTLIVSINCGVLIMPVRAQDPGFDRVPAGVAARGRIEPRDGLFAISGPSGPAAVVASLRVELGQQVKKGQLIALLDDVLLKAANVKRAKAQKDAVENERQRNLQLQKKKMISAAEMESLELRVTIADAELAQAQAELERTRVKSPIDGRVIAIHTREGERVGLSGIVELGRTQEMFVVAEVYETDIGRVKIGQQATAFSPALTQPLTGKVERIGLKVGKMEALATDPVSRADARVVEVEIRLVDSSRAADLTNLQVEVVLEN